MGINNPPLAVAASDSVTVAASKLLTESPISGGTCLEYQFWQLVFSCRDKPRIQAFHPWFCPILLGDFPQSCETKSGTESLGSRLLEVVTCFHSHLSRHLAGNTWLLPPNAGRQHTTTSFIVWRLRQVILWSQRLGGKIHSSYRHNVARVLAR